MVPLEIIRAAVAKAAQCLPVQLAAVESAIKQVLLQALRARAGNQWLHTVRRLMAKLMLWHSGITRRPSVCSLQCGHHADSALLCTSAALQL